MLFGKTSITRFGTLQGLMAVFAVALILGQLALTPALLAERTAHAASASALANSFNGKGQTASALKPHSTPPTGTITGTYSYYIPVIANQSAAGDTTYLTVQNTGSQGASGAAGTMTATVTITYYDSNGNSFGTASDTLAPFATWLPANPFAQGQADGSAIVQSLQPLNVIVSVSTPNGNGSFVVPMSASVYAGSTLPLFDNGSAGIESKYYFYNPNAVAIKATLSVISQWGVAHGQSGPFNVEYDFNFVIQPFQTYIFDPATNPLPSSTSPGKTAIPSGYYGYAFIGGLRNTSTYSPGSPSNPLYLVTLMQEYRSTDKFTAFYDYNGLNEHQSSSLFIPGVFKNAFGGFYTGMTFSPGYNNNPNQIVTVNFYDQSGALKATVQSSNLYYGSTYSLFTGSLTQLPDNFSGSAIATITTPDSTQTPAMQVIANTQGPATSSGLVRNGAFMGLENDYEFQGYQLPFPFNAPNNPQVLSLPIMANGAYGGFYTGTTLDNLLNIPITFTVQYLNTDGSAVAGTSIQTYTLTPHASLFVYQGANTEGLPANWFGVAVIKVQTPLPTPVGTPNQPYPTSGPYFGLMAQVNVQSGTSFYTYSSPGSLFQ